MANTNIKIAVITSSRADYGHLYWPLKHLVQSDNCDLRIIAFAAHLSHEFGNTVEQIRKDGFAVEECVECLLSSDSDVGMAKTIGMATLGLADVLGRLRPDLLLIIADRYEMLAPACVATALRIPIAHIEGGEVSEGAIDNIVRNALTKLSHIHLTPTATAMQRVLNMGEEAWRVHCVGTPSLDHLRSSALASRAELEQSLKLKIAGSATVVSYHPVTMYEDSLRETMALFAALESIDRQIIFCFPNAVAGSRELICRAREFCKASGHRHLFVNLEPRMYWSLLRQADLMVGNSSSGIMESPSIPLPCVNIGIRQRGRERAKNIIDAEPDKKAILAAIDRASDPTFRAALDGLSNPYGDGRAGERIAKILLNVETGEKLLFKQTVNNEILDRRDKGSADEVSAT